MRRARGPRPLAVATCWRCGSVHDLKETRTGHTCLDCRRAYAESIQRAQRVPLKKLKPTRKPKPPETLHFSKSEAAQRLQIIDPKENS